MEQARNRLGQSEMANPNFRNRDEYRRQMELEEARRAGLAPAAVDEDGKEINPHIPQYMSAAPWYLNQQHPSLKHQKDWHDDKKDDMAKWYDRGATTFQAKKFRKGACEKWVLFRPRCSSEGCAALGPLLLAVPCRRASGFALLSPAAVGR